MADKVMQYVGARYVPKFADPVEWQSNTSYEALTIVTYNNASYTSKIPVPATVGNPAENGSYWVVTGNYNGQVEQYRQETEEVKNSLSSMDSKIEQEISDRSALIFNNNGKANVPLGLSVEGALNANDGAEISGVLKYNNPQLKNNSESVPFISTSGVEYDLLTSNNAQAHQLIFGDSWVALDEVSTHPNRTNWYRDLLPYFPNMHNYGVGGSVYSDLSSQVEQANNDTSFVNSSVKTVVIVCGVNDFLRGEDSNTASNNLNTVLKRIYELFQNANVVTLVDTVAPFTLYTDNSFNDCWKFATSIMTQAICPVYSLSCYLLFQHLFESGGAKSYHLNSSGSNVLRTVISKIFNGHEPEYKLQVFREQSFTYTTSSGTATNNFNVAAESLTVGNYVRYGYYIMGVLSSDTSVQFNINIDDNTDYNYLIPMKTSMCETTINGSSTGYNVFNTTSTGWEVKSNTTNYDTMILYVNVHSV